MKTVIILTLLIGTVFCLPVKRSASSSESSEEMIAVQRPPPILQKADATMFQEETTETTPGDSNESTNDTEEADEESETDEDEDDENETDSSDSNSGETQSTIVPFTAETPLDPIINTGRGDSMGYPSDYKKNIVYADANNFEKLPSPYKSYSSDKLGGLTFVSKKTSAYDDQSFNDVEKEIQLHKALQVHDILEEDTSTPEMENMEPGDRQAALGGQEIVPAGNQESDGEGASAGESATDSASASQEGNEGQSDSSEETTPTPGAADSESDSAQSTESQESDSDEENTQTTEASIIIAK